MGMGAKSWSRGEREALLNRWRMGKGSTKKKPKWKSLELETPPLATTTSTATSATTTPEQGLDPQHPFLKMISKNVDGAVISTEKQQQQGASQSTCTAAHDTWGFLLQPRRPSMWELQSSTAPPSGGPTDQSANP